jgi:hypothetical protein
MSNITDRREWQPIETAPEGDEVNGPFFDVLWAGETHRYLPVPRREIDCFCSGGFVQRKHGYPSMTTLFRPQPTHWMSFVEPPLADSSQ